MTPSDLKAFFRKQIETVGADYAKDIEALSEEQLAATPGGTARSGLDISYEVSVVNNRIASRIRGEDPGPWPFEGWVKAPEGFGGKDRAQRAVSDSIAAVLAAWDSVPEGELNREIKLKTGQTNPLDLAFMCAYHTGYHDAQLNYVQALHGDDETHW